MKEAFKSEYVLTVATKQHLHWLKKVQCAAFGVNELGGVACLSYPLVVVDVVSSSNRPLPHELKS